MSGIQSSKSVDVGRNTPIDYVIAGMFGLLGGPVGVGLSILTIHLLAPHAGARQKWLVWFFAGILGVPISLVITGAMFSSEPRLRRYSASVAYEDIDTQNFAEVDVFVTANGDRMYFWHPFTQDGSFWRDAEIDLKYRVLKTRYLEDRYLENGDDSYAPNSVEPVSISQGYSYPPTLIIKNDLETLNIKFADGIPEPILSSLSEPEQENRRSYKHLVKP